MTSQIFTRRGLLAGLLMGGLLTGCGFKLRGTGSNQATFETVYFRFDDSVPQGLRQALRQIFQSAAVQEVDSTGLADLVVELGRFKRDINQTARSVTGQTTAELIRLSQRVEAYRMRDEKLIFELESVLLRDRQIDPVQRLAADRELQTIIEEMTHALARQIFDQVNRSYRLAEL